MSVVHGHYHRSYILRQARAFGLMAETVNILLHAEDRARLRANLVDRNRPLKRVQRAMIDFHSAEGLRVLRVVRRARVRRPAVWRW